jgi:hypothetical protein
MEFFAFPYSMISRQNSNENADMQAILNPSLFAQPYLPCTFDNTSLSCLDVKVFSKE